MGGAESALGGVKGYWLLLLPPRRIITTGLQAQRSRECVMNENAASPFLPLLMPQLHIITFVWFLQWNQLQGLRHRSSDSHTTLFSSLDQLRWEAEVVWLKEREVGETWRSLCCTFTVTVFCTYVMLTDTSWYKRKCLSKKIALFCMLLPFLASSVSGAQISNYETYRINMTLQENVSTFFPE